MPPIRTRNKRKPPPDGFEDIEDTLLEFENKMKDAENAPHDGKRRNEVLWPIFQISHQRSRYIYDMYLKEGISRDLYDWLLKNKYADPLLIAKWKKQGYEKLCCLKCIQTKETNFVVAHRAIRKGAISYFGYIFRQTEREKWSSTVICWVPKNTTYNTLAYATAIKDDPQLYERENI
ncbi:Component of the SF3b subcomplex of the U2 snRNP [Orbilia oligospora]|uniref:Component of the SF3b subcomplex of the U2 snRNP n=1 Tax=Orbilia oligospora TaxID=2813651 RepID=A0A6G1M937_ORBOL|nr:Component of the SF3b subcomplex of the U2 snRNP [Orbilia oligospora]KAF3248801.1 Component of the SF3b subcomplex of the U2 snRNP [Orbilia oligospora]